MDIKAALQKVTGRVPDDAQVQRIKAIAHELEIPPGDTMLAVLALMDVYYESISAVPAKMAAEADKAAKLAASGAQQEITAQSLACQPSQHANCRLGAKSVGESCPNGQVFCIDMVVPCGVVIHRICDDFQLYSWRSCCGCKD